MHEIEPTIEARSRPSCEPEWPRAQAKIPARGSHGEDPRAAPAVTGGEGEIEVEGSTVGEALDAVFDKHDGLRERITEDGDLRRFVNVYVSGEDIRFQDGLETAIADGDEVTILPAVAGG